MSKNVYELDLHETAGLNEFVILKVPGGWIYYAWDFENSKQSYFGTFVPYNKEIKEENNKLKEV